MQNVLLEMKNINKSFGATCALKDTCLTVREGEVHMLLGENGAGKSTLVKILAGTYTADSGEIFWKGEKVEIQKPADAHELGIGMVYQELALVEQMSVMENVLMQRYTRYGNGPFVNWRDTSRRAKEALDLVGLEDIDMDAPLGSFTLSVRQLVEIAKALSRDAKLLVLDEPTSALTTKETDKLFGIIEELKKKGYSFIFITHKMGEVFRIGDQVTVLRDGEIIGETKPISQVDEATVIRDMVGRVISDFYPKEVHVRNGETLLEVEGLRNRKDFRNVGFHVQKGEIVGIAGLVGSGCTEMVEAIFGLRKIEEGTIVFKGGKVERPRPDQSLREGMGMLTKNRRESVLEHLPVYQNITASNRRDFVAGRLFRKKKKERKAGEDYKKELNIAARTVELNAGALSGGNQQKVVLGRLLCANCDLFIMDDPTRGIDVGSKVEIYHILNRLTAKGCGIILISSEMPELVRMSDRIYVARRGRIVSELSREECTQENVMTHIAGGKK